MILSHNFINYYIQQHFINFIFTYYLIPTNISICLTLFIYCKTVFYIVLMRSALATIFSYHLTASLISTH